jgi:type IV pilus biogenesis protein CpaD/CtpE
VRARLLALLLLSSLGLAGLLAACGSKPPPVCQASPVQRSGQVPSVRASPEVADITGLLTSGESIQAGRAAQVRWLVDSRRAGPQLKIVANLTDTSTSFQQQVQTARRSGIRTEYDSTLTFSRPGCWQLAVSTGPTSGSLALQVAQRSG